MPEAFINRIATANPPHDVHATFLRFGQRMLKGDNRRAALFDRMADRSGISHRYSFLEPGAQDAVVDAEGFYRLGAFPDTAVRMKKFEACAPGLAVDLVWRFRLQSLAGLALLWAVMAGVFGLLADRSEAK